MVAPVAAAPTVTVTNGTPGEAPALASAVKIRVTLIVGTDAPRLVATQQTTVRGLLNEQNVTWSDLDRTDPDIDNPINDGGTVTVTRVEKVTYDISNPIDFDYVWRWDDRMTTEPVTLREGSPGESVDHWEAWKKNGVVTLRTYLGSEVVSDPVSQIEIYGGRKPLTSRDGARERRSLTVVATGYTRWDPGCGKYTAIGMEAKHGVVAVDPNVIPLGSRVYVDGYGPAIAGDTGGAIKGNRIDLCFDSLQEADDWGRRTVSVVIY